MRLHLKTAIWASGRTQRRLAAETLIPENRLSEIVCGWIDPSMEEQERIAGTLGASLERLFEVTRSPLTPA